MVSLYASVARNSKFVRTKARPEGHESSYANLSLDKLTNLANLALGNLAEGTGGTRGSWLGEPRGATLWSLHIRQQQ